MAVSHYAERAPRAAPGRLVACLWTRSSAGGAHRQLIVPDGCADLLWDGERLRLVGPDQGPRTVTAPDGARFAGLRLRPGAAGLLLGRVPAPDLCDQQPLLADLPGATALGPRPADVADRLAERLAGAPGPQAAADLLDRFAASLLPGYAPDPVVARVVAALGRPDPVRLPLLAEALGVSERQLRRRVTAAVGYGPKALHRVLRFQRALALGRTEALPLAEVAQRAGYADQAHLGREVRRLSGRTPAALLPVRDAGLSGGPDSGAA